MENQGKQLIKAVALALGVMLIWQMFFMKKPDEPAPTPPNGSAVSGSATPTGPTSTVGVTEHAIPTAPTTGPTAPTTGPTAPTTGPTAPTTGPTAPGTTVPSVARGAEQKITLTYPRLTATFSSYGGALTSWHLADPRYDHDATKGELIPKLPDGGAFNVNFASSTYVLPVKSEWVGEKISDTEVKYTISTPTLDVVKTFTVVPDAYIVRMTVRVSVKVPDDSEAHERLAVVSYGFQDPKDEGGGTRGVQARVWESATLRDGSLVATPIKSVLEMPRFERNIQWTGFEHPYLLIGFAPKLTTGTGSVEKATFAQPTGIMQTEMLFTTATFKRGDPSVTREIVGYLGPKNYDQLEGADKAAGFSTGFKEVIDLGWFAVIGRPLLWLLLKFYSIVGNWGIAIVLLTLLVKGATLYFTTKSMRSMKAMAALGPQMKAIQEKYKEDRQRQQIETMALYKQHGVNPLSGCLPILLQMPIWLALYRMLSNAGELYLQPFIPGWIDDLTGPDPVHVLPVVLMATMFVQARLTPTNPDPSQKMQQRMLQYGMPLMFGVMSFFFPAGLTLYIFTNTVLSALHSIYMNKWDKKSLEITAMIKKNQAAAERAKDGKAVKDAKDANPKKNGDATKPAAALAETSESASDDDDDEAPDDEAIKSAVGAPRVVHARQKRKKGRRR
jgi:YidC/Oxa1 family membrane protein insertase